MTNVGSRTPAESLAEYGFRRATRPSGLVVIFGLTLALFHGCIANDSNAASETPQAISAVAPPPINNVVAARSASFQFGYAVANDRLDDAEYADIVRRDASIVTAENAMKWDHIHPEPGVYDFSQADRIVASAQANGQAVRGHTLIWGNQLPAWIEVGDWNRDELIDVMREHITTVVTYFRDRYPGVVTQWDVVNEAFNSRGLRKDTVWQRVIGDDYIKLAFEFAHEADPNALLFYNDYFDDSLFGEKGAPGGTLEQLAGTDCESVPKCAATQELAQHLVDTDVPIHGIGLQGHIFDGDPLDYELFTAWTLPLGLEWALTEVDAPLMVDEGADVQALSGQADIYASIVESCVTSPNCNTVVVWGVVDDQSWIPEHSDGTLDHGLLYAPDFEPKPAAASVLAIVADANAAA